MNVLGIKFFVFQSRGVEIKPQLKENNAMIYIYYYLYMLVLVYYEVKTNLYILD